MTVDEIRERFLKFFEGRGHRIYPSDSLVPANDPTLLFTGAGMNQFKEEFLGRVRGPRRAATCQKCLRTGDLENVGRTPDHHTFFEMLGNFSFGDYFKKDAIVWAWEFLTEELGLKEKDLWVSVYKDDDEAYRIWEKIVLIHAEKIRRLCEKDNFWPASAPSKGPNGPCGPCSEIFFGGPDGVEVWNLVFTQFDRQDNGKLDPLPNKNIDTGMGLERIARVMQGKNTNFEIDLFEPIIASIRELSRRNLDHAWSRFRLNAIADHIRAVTFAIGDGVLPSNEERGYVIRKLIRKAFWYGRELGLEKPFLYKIVPLIAKAMKKPYPELAQHREDIAQAVLAEEERFKNTLQEGVERLDAMLDRSRPILSGNDAFKLYDTYGFPLDLTLEISKSKGVRVDIEGFKKCMEDQIAKSRGTTTLSASIFEVKGDAKLQLPDETVFIENRQELETEVVQVSGNSVFLKKTNFYGEKGGQVGDTGWLLKAGEVAAEVMNAIDIAGRIQHEIKSKGSKLKVGDKITAKIDIKRRQDIRRNHTATHLLHHALRKVLGEHVKQKGSMVAPDRLRFDFSHFKKVTGEELSMIEGLVNENIKNNTAVCANEMRIDEAKREGAIALFGEKYADTVRMVAVGDYSKELCGGTHVEKTGDIKRFKISSESSIASGVRRIEAVTGDAAIKKIKEGEDLIKEIAGELKTTPDNILKEIEKLTNRLKELERDFNAMSDRFTQSNIDELLAKVKKIKERNVIIAEIKNADMTVLRKTADAIKGRLKNIFFVLVSEKDEKLSMVVGAEPPANAADVLNKIGSGFGIKGGGRSDFAQAGGAGKKNINEILEKSKEILERYL